MRRLALALCLLLVLQFSYFEDEAISSLDEGESDSAVGNQAEGGYHLLTGEWWEPSAPFSVSASDWDGDGISNSGDTFPNDPALPPASTGASTCLIEEVGCYEPQLFNGLNSPSWTYSSLANTQAAKWGDYDGDGDLDAAFARVGERDQIFENIDGQLSDTPVWESSSRTNSWDIEWGDIDNDGDLDLMVGLDGPNLLYMNYNGVISTSAAYASSYTYDTNDVDFADMDGDGDLDVIACNNGASVHIYRNNGGTLAITPYWSSQKSGLTYDCDVGDINKDGRMDLVIGWYDAKPAIHINSAAGLPTAPTWQSISSYKTKDVSFGDVNGDGKLDLAVAVLAAPDLIFLNVENGILSGNPDWESSFSVDTFDVDWGDVDGDGDLDLAFGTISSNRVLINNGSFFDETMIWESSTASETESIEFGDVDGDGDLDILTGNWGSAHEVFLNPGTAISPLVGYRTTSSPVTYDAELFDINNDDILEIAIASGNNNEIHTLVDGTYQHIWTQDDDFNTNAMIFADFDGDGDQDMAIASEYEDAQVFFNHNGSFPTTANWSTSGMSKVTYDVAWGDFNNDGHLDLAIGNTGSQLQVHHNDGAGNLSVSPDWTSTDSHSVYGLSVADLNLDGRDDLVVAVDGYNVFYLQSSSGLPEYASWNSNDFKDTNTLEVGDLDGDGDIDMVGCSYNEGITIYRNLGNAQFNSGPSWTSTTTYKAMDCELGDVDDDGDLDVIVAAYNERNSVHLNDGGTFSATPSWTIPFEWASWGVDAGDVDNDGTLDIMFGNTQQVAQVFRGGVDLDGDWKMIDEDDMEWDPTQYLDTDGDGLGENINGTKPDACTGLWGDSWRDRWGCPDLDSDGQSDLNDPFMQQPSQWSDIDNDGRGDNWADGAFNSSRTARGLGMWVEDAYLPDYFPWDYDNDGYEDSSLQSLGASGLFDDCEQEHGTSFNDRYGCRDLDYDGWSDLGDSHPGDATQYLDSDGDGYGDNQSGTNPDAFPNDGTQYRDSDGDGHGDEQTGNSPDMFPYDPTQWQDSDGDGYGDDQTGTNPDRCPTIAGNSTIDRLGCVDQDGDGYSDLNDFNSSDPLRWSDSDGDLIADQLDDDCPSIAGTSTEDRTGCADSDYDGWSDADSSWLASPLGLADSHPEESTQWRDGDGDGYGDSINGSQPDACPDVSGVSRFKVELDQLNSYLGCVDGDGDGIEDSSDDCPTLSGSSKIGVWGCPDTDGDGFQDVEDDCPGQAGNSSANLIACPDSDYDGIADLEDPRPLTPLTTTAITMDWDGDGVMNSRDVFPFDETQWSDDDNDGLGDNPNGTNPDPKPGDRDNDGWGDPANFATDGRGCLIEVEEDADAFPLDSTEWLDSDGDCIGDNSDLDDDDDGYSDVEEIQQGTDPFSSSSKPIESFEVVLPGTAIGLGAWDLIGIFLGIPLFSWLGFCMFTRNSRCNKFEDELNAARSRGELEQIAKRYEFALMIRLLGIHQGIRLERLRTELDDVIERGFETPTDLPINGNAMESNSSSPDTGVKGMVTDDGYEWLEYGGGKWYRLSGTGDAWKAYEQP